MYTMNGTTLSLTAMQTAESRLLYALNTYPWLQVRALEVERVWGL
jgi:hypothetical protein